jgi:hypothetical protein
VAVIQPDNQLLEKPAGIILLQPVSGSNLIRTV